MTLRQRTRRKLVILAIAGPGVLVAAASVGVAAMPASSPAFAPRVATLAADPDGPATQRVTVATKRLLACFEAAGATREPLPDEPGFTVRGVTEGVHAACAAEEAEWEAADRSLAYRREQDALAVVLGEAWRCVAARGFIVAGINDQGIAGGHIPEQAGIGRAFDRCVADVAKAYRVTVPS